VERSTVDLLPSRLRDSATARAGATRLFSTFAGLRYGVRSERAAELAKEMALAAFDRLESELGGSDYLVGERFSVADLTAAALFYPIVQPPEAPRVPRPPAGVEEFRAPLRERPGYRWVEEMFRRHREKAPEPIVA
jgi:glutathione S-transferase